MDEPLPRQGGSLHETNRTSGTSVVAEDEQIDMLDLEDEADMDPTLPPTEDHAPRGDRRLAPFLEVGGGVLRLPLPAGHQTRMPTALETWDGFTWPTARLAAGLDLALGKNLDLSLAIPFYLHFGAATLTVEEGEITLLMVADDQPTTAWGTGLELLLRPRMPLGKTKNP